MPLLPSELIRLRKELGYNVLGVAAEPYVEYHGALDRVVSLYLSAGATTTSSTAVTAATSPTPATLTLASATGFATFAAVIVDVDDRRERATVQSVSGSTITVLLEKAHTGTYPVCVEGGESIVRDFFEELDAVQARIAAAASTAGLKRAEDIEWYPSGGSVSGVFGELKAQQMDIRDELASALGVTNLWRTREYGGSHVVLY